MDKVLDNISKAMQRLKTADYMLTMTYETLKEPKLLLTIANTLFLATKEAIDASLYYERHFKRIPPFNENSFEAKLDMFKKKLSLKYKLEKSDFGYINELRQINEEHKTSAVEFSRHEKLFMFDEDYNGETLDKERTRILIINAKLFIEKIYFIISTKR